MSLTVQSAKIAGVALLFGLLAACGTTKPPAEDGAEVPLTLQQEFATVVGDRVFFDFDRYEVRPDGMATLQRQAEFLNGHPELMVRIEGHADERGTREYNLALGDRRANSVRQALVGLGVDRSRLSTISYGKDRPDCADSNESCWARNRRGVSVLTNAAGS